MDHKEEQQQEIEILQSIYPDEFEQVDETHFNITLRLETTSERTHILVLHVEYPDEYPEVVPGLSIEVDVEEPEQLYEAEEDSDEEDTKPVIISELVEFDDDDVETFTQRLNDEAVEQVGMPSVFSLCSSLKEIAEELFDEKVAERQKVHDEELLAKEREEQKKFYGTKVTRETFEAWRTQFREETDVDKRVEIRKQEYHKGKLTGKEIFERGLAGEEDDLNIKELSIED